ncbi:uncharacterized protein MKS88_000139 [Plasmodium brasilianum]|uniref:uncharacterized protein n=1 Tax=Plasmodium brasilianum TaxID=5824 RepID=UPI00350E3E15|nr:hypothetical protein MKS88_000139 [Plasmodium brasilianum]
MEQKIKLLFFIKFSKFMLLIWICHFYNDKKKKRDLNIVSLNEDIADNGEREKKSIYNNESVFTKEKKQSNRYPLNKAQYYTEVMDYNNGIFDGKYFHFEKKWIKKKDYDSFIEKNRKIRDIKLKKIKFRSYGFGVFIFFLFFLFGIGLPILNGLNYLKEVLSPLEELLKLAGDGVEKYSFLILFDIVIIILSVLVVGSIPKILRNNEKYKKIKYMTE